LLATRHMDDTQFIVLTHAVGKYDSSARCSLQNAPRRTNSASFGRAIESYKEMITYLGQDDPTTKRLLESILTKEEEHVEDLSSMLRVVAARPPLKAVSI
jgi:hypothetical protein